MKNLSGTVKLLLLLAIVIIGIFALEACVNSPLAISPSPVPPKAPYVLDFYFQAPSAISNARVEALEAALGKHAAVGSKVTIDGKDIWPKLSGMKTDRVVTSERGARGDTRLTRGRSTQVINFRTAADMRAFMREISE